MRPLSNVSVRQNGSTCKNPGHFIHVKAPKNVIAPFSAQGPNNPSNSKSVLLGQLKTMNLRHIHIQLNATSKYILYNYCVIH